MSAGKWKYRRTKGACIHNGKRRDWQRGEPLCRLTTYEACVPETCPWFMTSEMLEASYEQARQNYIKNHGCDRYYQLGYAKRDRREEG